MTTTHLYALDIAVVVVYLAVVVGKGVAFTKKQKGVDDYFLAGRKMGWFAVGISIMASVFSAITYLGGPAETFRHDLQYTTGFISVPFVVAIVVVVFLPFYYNLNIYTAYEYLERRFSLPMRLTASAFFMFWRLSWMALVLYAPSLALSEFLGLDWRISILVTGLGSTLYTVLGGITAVIWTDVMQFFVLVAGIVAVAIMCIIKIDGGLPAIYNIAHQNNKLVLFDFRFDPTLRLTFWSVLLGGFVANLSAYATDQVAVQRYLTTTDLRASKQSLIFNAGIIIPICLGFYWVGTMLWVFYHVHPHLLAGFDMTHPDRILPFFVVQNLPVGLRGLVVAALFAATMSSVDSGINSITTTTLMDFFKQLSRRHLSDSAQLLKARKWTIFWGMFITGLAIGVGYWGATLVEMSQKLAGWFMGPLLGIFLLAIFTRRATAPASFIGAALGFGTVLYVGFGTEISFMLYSVIGCLVTVVTGMLLSYLWTAPPPEKTEGLTYQLVRRKQQAME